MQPSKDARKLQEQERAVNSKSATVITFARTVNRLTTRYEAYIYYRGHPITSVDDADSESQAIEAVVSLAESGAYNQRWQSAAKLKPCAH